jgi:hypothetical protein
MWELGHKALLFDLQHQSPAGECPDIAVSC